MRNAAEAASILTDGRAGEFLLPGGAGWSQAAPLYLPGGEPAAVVRPSTAAEVSAAVLGAGESGLGISVRSGGHGAVTFPNPGGVLIDLARMKQIRIDGSRVSIGGGALWGDIARELGTHGLAISSGDTKSVGVGGLSTGGGIGWMVRTQGLAIDSLVAAEVVLASGEIVAASAHEHPDLFWALRGGGGNFGIVTTFVFDAHPLDGVVVDVIDFARDDLRGVLRGYRDHMREAPEELNVTFLAYPPMGPDEEPITQLIAVYPGRDVAGAEPLTAGLRALPGFLRGSLVAMDYVDVLEDDPEPFEGEPPTIVSNNSLTNDFSESCIDAAVAAFESSDGAMLMVRYLRGAYNRVPAESTAWAHRDSEALVVHAAFLPPQSPAEHEQRVHDAWAGMAEFTSGMYGNFSMATGDSVLETMYPPATRERLRVVKRVYDPANLFSHNHNVAP